MASSGDPRPSSRFEQRILRLLLWTGTPALLITLSLHWLEPHTLRLRVTF